MNTGAESKSQESLAGGRPVPVYIVPYDETVDEISLIDLWSVIVRRKAIIFASLLLSVFLAFAYLFFSEPMYKTNAYLLPPQPQNIQELLVYYRSIEGADTEQYTPAYVYDVFLGNLRSLGMRRKFFEDHKLINHYVSGESAKGVNADLIFHEYFSNRLTVQVDKNDDSFVTVSFRDGDPKLAEEWLNEIIDFTNERTVHQLFSGVTAAIKSEIAQVRYRLDSKLKLARQNRLDRIVTLNEALRIARTLGIQDASTFPRVSDKTQAGLAVNTAQMPLYMRGIGALETEIMVLESRKSDEPFISGFRDLQERLTFLEGISVDSGKLSAVTVDSGARVPYMVDTPRSALILALGVILGAFAGLFMAFLAELVAKMRRGREESST